MTTNSEGRLWGLGRRSWVGGWSRENERKSKERKTEKVGDTTLLTRHRRGELPSRGGRPRWDGRADTKGHSCNDGGVLTERTGRPPDPGPEVGGHQTEMRARQGQEQGTTGEEAWRCARGRISEKGRSRRADGSRTWSE
eukprot:1157519-Rhodomonas_salina.1